MRRKEIIVIGAGAAGLMAAGRAAEAGARVRLIEKMDKPGRKLLITGGGRCNFTNKAPIKEFITHFGPSGAFLYQAFSRFFSTELIAFFHRLGISAETEEDGRVFPKSGSAKDIVDALVKWVEAAGATIKTGARIKALVVEAGRVAGIKTSDESVFSSDAVILACGGASYPATGSTGDGYRLARSVGHTIVPIRPALVPLVTGGSLACRLQGVGLKDVSVRVIVDGKKESERTGEMLFTHFGLSGPAILSLSRQCVDWLAEKRKVDFSIDLKPEMSETELDAYLQSQLNEHGKQQLGTLLNRILARKLVPVCSDMIGASTKKPANQVSGIERRRLRAWLKDFRLELIGHKSFREAMITAGGVELKEVDPRSMGSRLVEGLYFAGEVLNLDADTGGYNLQEAFSTGWVAGEASVRGDEA